MENNRKHSRFGPVLIRADFKLENEGSVHKGYVTNLSRGGAFLATRESIAVGTSVHLLVSLPWQLGQIAVEAQAKWRRGEDTSSGENPAPGVGLQFANLDEDSLAKIQKYLDKFQELASRLPSLTT